MDTSYQRLNNFKQVSSRSWMLNTTTLTDKSKSACMADIFIVYEIFCLKYNHIFNWFSMKFFIKHTLVLIKSGNISKKYASHDMDIPRRFNVLCSEFQKYVAKKMMDFHVKENFYIWIRQFDWAMQALEHYTV